MRKQKQLTFGSLFLPANTESRYYGFTYKILFADGYYYIGQRCFDEAGKWMSYVSSSKYIVSRLSRVPATFQFLSYANTERQLNRAEYLLIQGEIENLKNLNYSIGKSQRNNSKLRIHKLMRVI